MRHPRSSMLPPIKIMSLTPLAILVILTFFVPFFWVVDVMIILRVISRAKKKPRMIFHFIKSTSAFNSIKHTRCLLSLTGGRCYATSMMNPFLGADTLTKEESKYIIVITGEALCSFKPIISRKIEIFEVWKWWKLYRKEWVSKEKKDLNIQLSSLNLIHEEGSYKRWMFSKKKTCPFKGYFVKNLTELESSSRIIFLQKKMFQLGEWSLSFLAASAIAAVNMVMIQVIVEHFNPAFDLIAYLRAEYPFTCELIFYSYTFIAALFSFVAVLNLIFGFFIKRMAIRERAISQLKKLNPKKLRYYECNLK